MIAFIRGTLFSYDAEKVILDTGSVGYQIFVPTPVLHQLPPKHAELMLYTYHSVREDEETLYGFLDTATLSLFEMLLSVSGIGPKVALSILSGISVSDFRFAILSEDTKTLSRLPGIGPKTAGRMILELKDKIGKTIGENRPEENVIVNACQDENRENAILGLVSLGFTVSEATRAVSGVSSDCEDPGQIMKEALRLLQ